MGTSYIHELAQVTGLAPSHLQFIEMSFQDVFDAAGLTFKGAVQDARGQELVRSIYQLRFERKLSESETRAALAGRQRASESHIIAITSGKGGVGKSTMAVNLAAACAHLGRRTLLVDADLGLANVHVLAGLSPQRTLLDVALGRAVMHEVVEPGPGGIHVVCGASGDSRLANLDARGLALLDRQLLALARSYDTILLDTGAGISAQVLHFLGLAGRIVVVLTPNLAATLDGYGVIKIVRQTGLAGALGVVVNQAESEAQAGLLFDRVGGCARRFLGGPPEYLGWLRQDPGVEASHQARTPLVISQPHSDCARQFGALAERLVSTRRPLKAATHAKLELAGSGRT